MNPLALRIRALWARHEVRYLVVAGFVSVLSWSLVALGMWLGWHYMVSTVFAQVAPIPVAFPLYRGLVFRSRGTPWRDFLRFASVWGSGMIAPILGAPLLVEGLHVDPVLTQVLITVVVAIGSYLGHRFFSFRTHAREGAESGGSKVEETAQREGLAAVLFIALCASLYAAWSLAYPFNEAPDEFMRYQIVHFIVEHGQLPVGDDPRLRDPIWGTSYAFQPILGYMVGAVFAKASALAGGDAMAQLHAARLAPVLFGTGTVAVCVAMARRLFTRPWRWVFPVAVALLPQFAYLSSYVNTDSLGLFASSLLVFAWLKGLRDGWSVRNAVFLGVALSVCALSYYNAYGFILMSIVVFMGERVVSVARASDRGAAVRMTVARIGIIVAVCAVLTGWWFVRNGILYDGDILGLASSDAAGERYAVPTAKPGAASALGRGWSVERMLFGEVWLARTAISAIGVFGYMTVYLARPAYLVWLSVAAVGIAGAVVSLGRAMLPVRISGALTPVAESAVLPGLAGPRRRIAVGALAGAVVIPWLLSFYFSWTQDFQAQGRYILPMLVPFMFFMTAGLAWVVERIVRSPRGRVVVAAVIVLALAVVAAYAFFGVLVPTYRGW